MFNRDIYKTLIIAAITNFKQKNHELAMKFLNAAIEIDKECHQAYVAIANAKFSAGDFYGAAEFYKLALTKQPEFDIQEKIILKLATTNEMIKNFEHATAIYDREANIVGHADDCESSSSDSINNSINNSSVLLSESDSSCLSVVENGWTSTYTSETSAESEISQGTMRSSLYDELSGFMNDLNDILRNKKHNPYFFNTNSNGHQFDAKYGPVSKVDCKAQRSVTHKLLMLLNGNKIELLNVDLAIIFEPKYYLNKLMMNYHEAGLNLLNLLNLEPESQICAQNTKSYS